MATIQELAVIGEKMGLKDKELQTFITQQQSLAREDREKEREIEKMKQHLEADKIKLAFEQEANKKLALELKKQQGGSDDENSGGNNSGGAAGGTSHSSKIKGPKMAPFDEKDDMDSYLFRYERYAELQGWKTDDWAIYLAALLRGKALDVYARLTAEESKDYKVLKDALLRRYQMTEDGYKRRFYSAKPEGGESPAQFITRLSNYLIRWIDLAEVEETFNGVCSLIIREQYMSTCSKDLELFLRERAETDLAEIGKLAEQYEDAHRSGSSRRGGQQKEWKATEEDSKGDSNGKGPVRQERGHQAKKCFICSKVGHIAKNCFKRVQAGALMQRTTNQRPWQQRGGYIGNRNYGEASVGSNSGNLVSQQAGMGNTNMAYLYCKIHGRQQCTECNSTAPPAEKHTCNALLAPEVKLECGCKLPVVADACNTEFSKRSNMPVAKGWMGGKEVSVLRDTGCSAAVVRSDLVAESQLTGKSTLCILIDGTARRAPLAKVEVDTPYYKGLVEALCLKKPIYDLILGNIPGVLDKPDLVVTGREVVAVALEVSEEGEAVELQAVVTRAQAKKDKTDKPLNVASINDINVPVDTIKAMQKGDKTLQILWQKVETGETKTDDESTVSFKVKRGLLYRRRQEHGGTSHSQLVVPEPLRETVLRLGHDNIMSGHLGIKKTYDRILSHFFWPGLHGDASRYCKSCDICQRTVVKGKVMKVPLGNMPLIETPFQRVAVDLVGPIAPCTDRGGRYILTLVDYATRYPEATVLKNIEAETVAEALVTMFTRVGVPEEVLSDQGSQFMSSVMKGVSRLLSINQLATTPYHPMCNGLVEKFNGTLKAMLRRMCAERPKDWDRYLPALLFAYREAPQESLGFSPFELLYGRTVRGPMAILKDIWSKAEVEPVVKTTYEYVLDLQSRLQETCTLTRDALIKAQITQKRHFDVKARNREFQAGDKVLLLLTTDNNKLLSQWKGPFEVLERMRGHNYRIQLPSRVRLFHANMIKRYNERNSSVLEESEVLGAAVIELEEGEEDTLGDFVTEQHETYKEVQINPELSTEQQEQVKELIAQFSDIFTDVPKVTNLGEHAIKLTSLEPIRSRPYPLPYALREIVDKEIETMLQLGVIEPSTASYAAPIVMVKKSDGSNRICIDYRKLNKVTVFDPEPMPQAEEIFAELAGSNFLSKFDFAKGYWQVPMRPEDRDVTTFVTHQGLFRFKVMPFGLVNAPATFSRIMRKLMYQLKQLKNYLDDVLAHTSGWSEHVDTLKQFFERVRAANLVLRPTKCFVGFYSVTFLGHKVGSQGLGPTTDKLEKIEKAPAPRTKKQLRSFMGLVGYYRNFVPNFAAIAVPLTDLTKKGTPNQLPWGDTQDRAFVSLKRHVCNPPILRLPELCKPFILQTDASNDGLGAILLQEDNGVKLPIAFAIKKLLYRERNYSTIEREALAIVWGVEKFEKFLYGQHFFLETDHQPLQYIMNAKFQNGRLMRWALALQPYRFTVRAIKGSQNVGADFLSRHAC